MRVLVFILFLGAAGCGINTPPRLVALGNQEIGVNETLELTITAADSDGDKLTFSIADKPPRAAFEPTALGARFRWTPIASDVPAGAASAVYRVTFYVDDGNGGRDGETVLITVVRRGPGEGAPTFISPADYVLDLATQSSLRVTLEVQDNDSAQVSFALLAGPEGAIVGPLGPKSAELFWEPTAAQIEASLLYGFRVSAQDGVHPAVEQEITVLLRRKPGGSCPGTPPQIRHTALTDQSRAGPYPVEATITDAESTIRSATLFWTRRPSPTSNDFEGVPLTSDRQTPGRFTGSLPDLGLAAGASATVTYFLCATDDDDASGDACDHVACFPEGERRLSFVVTGGASACVDDTLEPNDSFGAARTLTAGTPVRGLRICPGNEDWFKVNLLSGETLDAVISFTHANGNLDLAAYAPNGTTLLAESRTSSTTSNEERVSITATGAGTYYLRVHGAAGASNSYDLSATVRAACTDDAQEPNDTFGAAKEVTPGTLAGLVVCAGNDDWYKVQVRAGGRLDVSIAFTHSQGDLDLEVYEPDGTTRMGLSDGVGDGESLSFRVMPRTGFYYVRVYGYRGAQNRYSLTVTAGDCLDDTFSPNQTQPTAASIAPGTYRLLALCASTSDWYKVSLAAGQHVRVALLFRHAYGDIDLKVLGTDGTTTLGSSLSTTDNEEVDIASVPATGIYFIQVVSFTGAQNAYDLVVELLP